MLPRSFEKQGYLPIGTQPERKRPSNRRFFGAIIACIAFLSFLGFFAYAENKAAPRVVNKELLVQANLEETAPLDEASWRAYNQQLEKEQEMDFESNAAEVAPVDEEAFQEFAGQMHEWDMVPFDDDDDDWITEEEFEAKIQIEEETAPVDEESFQQYAAEMHEWDVVEEAQETAQEIEADRPPNGGGRRGEDEAKVEADEEEFQAKVEHDVKQETAPVDEEAFRAYAAQMHEWDLDEDERPKDKEIQPNAPPCVDEYGWGVPAEIEENAEAKSEFRGGRGGGGLDANAAEVEANRPPNAGRGVAEVEEDESNSRR